MIIVRSSKTISSSDASRIFLLAAFSLGVLAVGDAAAQEFSTDDASEITGLFSEDVSTPAGGITSAMMRTLAPGEGQLGMPVEVENDHHQSRSQPRSIDHGSSTRSVPVMASGEPIEIFDPMVAPRNTPPRFGAGSAGESQVKESHLELQQKIHQNDLWAPPEVASSRWRDSPLGLQVGADLLYFSRSLNNVGAAPFARNDAGETFSLSEVQVDPQTTARYRFAIASEYGTGYEFVGYDFGDFAATLSLSGQGITPVFFGGVPAEPVDAYTASYQSSIKSFELNIWARRSESLRVGYGLRHFAIEESFDITQDDPPTPATGGGAGPTTVGFFSTTDNRLIGGQIMVELFRRITAGSYLEGGVKGMLLNNRSELDVETETIQLSGEDSSITGGVNFHGGISYRPFRGFNLRAGYEGVFIGSVASGLSQSENNNLFEGSISPVGESLYYGGGYFGCTITF